MKKLLYALLFTFFLTTISAHTVWAQTYTCTEGSDAVGWCGERGGCSPGQMCISYLTTSCRTAAQADAAIRCENADDDPYWCGGWNTNDYCGSDGGCLAGYRCEVTKNMLGIMTGSKCVADETKCGKPETPVKKCLNTAGCGFCENPQEYCSVSGGFSTCTKIVGQCGYNGEVPAGKCGVEVYEDGKYKCKVDGVEVTNFYNCAWVSGMCCPSTSMCTDDTGKAPGCGKFEESATNGASKVCNINGVIHTSGFSDCSSNPSTPNSCCYGISCPALQALSCGQTTSVGTQQCSCGSGLKEFVAGTGSYCCGYPYQGTCYKTQAEADAAQAGTGGPGDGTGGDGGSADGFSIFEGPSSETFKKLNPLAMFGVDARTSGELSSPGGIISRVLRFAFPVAGLILFVMLVWAGFEILYNAAGSKSIQQGSQRATAAIVGFVLLFCSYFIMQLIEIVFGITVL